MFSSLFFKKVKKIKRTLQIPSMHIPLLIKTPLFLTGNHHLISFKNLVKMHKHYVLLNRIITPRLRYVILSFNFFYWATFKSFRPVFISVYKKKMWKTRRKRPKFIVRTAVSDIISSAFVKKWMNKYFKLLPMLYAWQKMLFIYVSLIQTRLNTPVFYWYTRSAVDNPLERNQNKWKERRLYPCCN